MYFYVQYKKKTIENFQVKTIDHGHSSQTITNN